jgi:hypothetical protein
MAGVEMGMKLAASRIGIGGTQKRLKKRVF